MKFLKKNLKIKKGKNNKVSKEKITKRNLRHIIIIKEEIDSEIKNNSLINSNQLKLKLQNEKNKKRIN